MSFPECLTFMSFVFSLAVKMASVADTALNHHSLTPSLTIMHFEAVFLVCIGMCVCGGGGGGCMCMGVMRNGTITPVRAYMYISGQDYISLS